MADPKREKLNIILKLIAFKASCDGFPILNIRNSLPSLNKSLNAIQFLLDLIESLIGVEKLKELLIEMLSFNLDEIETTIKTILKLLIKQVFSCGISPTIPLNFITQGVDIDLKRVDFFDTLKTDPNSDVGTCLYGDPNEDFNYFLYETIQQTTPNTWDSILTITYYGPNTPVLVDNEQKLNVINIKIHPSYLNKSIFTFLNNFIDSIRFLPKQNVVPKIIDSIFGTLTSASNKGFSVIQEEVKFEKMVDKIINDSDNEELTIDDSFFKFTNDQLFEIEQETSLRQSGTRILVECSNTPSYLPLSGITTTSTLLANSTSSTEVNNILTVQLGGLSDDSVSNVSDENKDLGKKIFFKNLILGFIKVIVKALIGPAIMVVLSIYFKLAYGTFNYTGVIEFVKNNAKMYIDMIKEAIIGTVQRILLKFLFNILKEIIICNFIENKKQSIVQYRKSLESLVAGGQTKYIKLLNSLSKLGITL